MRHDHPWLVAWLLAVTVVLYVLSQIFAGHDNGEQDDAIEALQTQVTTR